MAYSVAKSTRPSVQNFNSHSRQTGPIQELATRLDGSQNLGPEKLTPLGERGWMIGIGVFRES
jgi:hypothetical protein